LLFSRRFQLGFAQPMDPRKTKPIDYFRDIAAPDRTEADRQTDKRRDPVSLLVFAAVRPGNEGARYGGGRRVQH